NLRKQVRIGLIRTDYVKKSRASSRNFVLRSPEFKQLFALNLGETVNIRPFHGLSFYVRLIADIVNCRARSKYNALNPFALLQNPLKTHCVYVHRLVRVSVAVRDKVNRG